MFELLIIGAGVVVYMIFLRAPAGTVTANAGVPNATPTNTSANSSGNGVDLNPKQAGTPTPQGGQTTTAQTAQSISRQQEFLNFVARMQPANWNGMLLPQQWNYYYAMITNTLVSASHKVASSSAPIGIEAYWSLRSAAHLTL